MIDDSRRHMHQPPVLAATLHDPESRLLKQLDWSIEGLGRYAAVVVVATDATAPGIVQRLRDSGAHVEIGPTGFPGAGQRRAIELAGVTLDRNVFVCDFDRWLHWHATYPKELSLLPECIDRHHADAWYVCLGRTDRAMATHPVTQFLPETATNRALSTIVGTTLDATAGAAWIRPPGVRLILDGSIAPSKATDLEWPALVWRKHPGRVAGLLVEGLEFETADAYAEEIRRAGSREAWIREVYDRPSVQQARLQLAVDSIAALRRVLGDT